MSTVPDVTRFSESPPEETKDFIMQQTMIRVKDPVKSLEFYHTVLGMRLLWHCDFTQWGFSVYFVAPMSQRTGPLPTTEVAKWKMMMTTPGCIELTWNHGSEKAEDKVYNTGNADPTGTGSGQAIKGGFGHLGVTMPDVYAACERFKELGVEFHKSPNAGGMKGLAFIKDPDGYLIEILPQEKDATTGEMPTKALDCCGVSLTGGAGYADNSKASVAETKSYSQPTVQGAWDNHFSAFGSLDVEKIKLDYCEQSVVRMCQEGKEVTTHTGVEEIGQMFIGLFGTLEGNMEDTKAPSIIVEEAEKQVFLIWSCQKAGISHATDTFIFNAKNQIIRQNIVWH